MIYSKIENGVVIESQTVGKHRGKPLEYGGKKFANPQAAHYAAAGWKRRADQVVADGQELTALAIVAGNSYTLQIKEKTVEDKKSILAARMQALDMAARQYIDDKVHWTAGPMIFDKAKAKAPKSKAIKEWTESLWLEYYTRVAMLEAGEPWVDTMLDFSSVGPIPYKIKEAMAE